MNEENILSFLDEYGNEKKFNILSQYTVGTQSYIALKRYDGGVDIEIYRAFERDGLNIELSCIKSDSELEEAKRGFYKNFKGSFSINSKPPEYIIDESAEPDPATVISITDNEGKNHECQIILTFTFNNKDYIALMPLETKQDESMNINLYEYETSFLDSEYNRLSLSEIPTYAYDDVCAYFMEQIAW